MRVAAVIGTFDLILFLRAFYRRPGVRRGLGISRPPEPLTVPATIRRGLSANANRVSAELKWAPV
jgi:hypothetical protein